MPGYLRKWVERLGLHIKTCTWKFTGALFITAKTEKQPRCPSVGKWINGGTYKQYYSELKRNELSSHAKTQRNLECILLSQRSQSEKATYCMIPTIWHQRKGETMETNKTTGCQGLEGRDGWLGGAQRIFRAVKLFCMMLQWWTHVIIHSSKFKECTTPTVNAKVNYGLGVTTMCQ